MEHMQRHVIRFYVDSMPLKGSAVVQNLGTLEPTDRLHGLK